VDPETGRVPLAGFVRRTRPVVVVTSRRHAGKCRDALRDAEVTARLVVADDTSLRDRSLRGLDGLGNSSVHPNDSEPEQVAGLLATSGTSGEPKLVQLTQRNYVMSGERLARNGGYTVDDRHYLATPFHHTNAQFYSVMPALVTGASIGMVPAFSASGYFLSASRLQCTVSSMIATLMRMALHAGMERRTIPRDPALRLIWYGMTMSAHDWALWDERLGDIAMRQVYGQTETASAVLGGAPWEQDDRATIGRPLLGVDGVRLMGGGGAPVGPGEQGELHVKGEPGASLMLGYLDDPERTASALEGWMAPHG
jgi:crotonobetaine/carnitine-CoA ligase